MIELYLIRHAESVLNANGIFIGGRSNYAPLSKKGEFQSELLGIRFINEKMKFKKIYSSIAVRAKNTAQISCKKAGFLEEIIFSDRIVELDQGDWEGEPRDEIYTEEILKKINLDRWNFKAPNGESQKEGEERMMSFVENEIVSKYNPDEKNVFGVFTHGFLIKCFLRGIIDFDPKRTYCIAINNTSITKLEYDAKGWHLFSLNDTDHLKNHF
jgi:broad specificity phosphatase PhoE